MRRVVAIAVGVITLLALPQLAQAATVTVTTANDSGAGSLRDAISSSSTGDTIDFAPALDGQAITLTSGALVIPHALTISGPGAGSLTVSGNNASPVFAVQASSGGDVTISGLTVTAGSYTGGVGGAGINAASAGSLTLSGMTITGNHATITPTLRGYGGGGVAAEGFPLTVTNSTITNNTVSVSGACCDSAGGGAGILSNGGTTVVTGSMVSGNTVTQTGSTSGAGGPASNGGAGIYSNGGDLTVTNTTVDNNSANIDQGRRGDGGSGIYSNGGTTILTDTTVDANTLTLGNSVEGGDGGGGVYSDGGATTISSSTIDGNSATVTDSGGFDGGMGLLSEGGSLTITDSTIAQNAGTVNSSGDGSGGGAVLDEGVNTAYLNSTLSDNSITVNGSGINDGGGAIHDGNNLSPVISDVTIAGNSTNTPGGAMYAENGANFTLKNTIVADNTASPAGNCSGAGTFSSDGFDIDSGNSCGFAAMGDLTNTEPRLAALANNGGPAPTQALPAGSPAIDAGSCTDVSGATVATDERGVSRPQGAGCDIGAFEYVASSSPPPPPPALVNIGPPSVTGTPLPGDPLGCSTGSWTGNPTRYAYQWNRDRMPISGASVNRYLVAILDEAQTLSCTVIASNAGGSAAATSNGVLVAINGTRRCRVPFGRLRGVKLGPFTLGMSRKRARKQLKPWHVTPYGYDDFCLYAGWGIRVGYPSAKLLGELPARKAARLADTAIVVLTANPFYKLHGVTVGLRVASVAKRLHLSSGFHVGLNWWYFGPGAGANALLKVRGGIIQEIGIVNKAITTGRTAQARFVHSFIHA